MTDALPNLGDLEREVMMLVWQHGPIIAETVRERLNRPLKESTVRTVLRRLEEKGYVQYGSVKPLLELPDGPPQAICATPPGTE